MTPSISTSGVPLTVATITTRISGIGAPAEARNRVWSGEPVLTVKVSWNPPGPSPPVFTVTAVSASSTSRGTGNGTAGPIISVSWTPSTIARSRDPFGQRDAQHTADALGQLGRPHHRVRVAQPPRLLRVAEILRRERVGPLALGDHVLAEQREPVRRRDEAATQVDDRPAV